MNSITTEKKELTLFEITWPILIENILRISLITVDTLMLSQYSEKSVAAVGAVNQIMGMIFLLYCIVSTGTAIVIAQYLGAKEEVEARQAANYAFSFNILFGLAISMAAALFAPNLIRIMNLPAELHSDGITFLRILGGSSFFHAILATTTATLRSYGLTRVSMAAMIGMNILNVLGNALVLKSGLPIGVSGVQGVACATALSQIITALALFYYLIRKINLQFSFRALFDTPTHIIKNIYRIGIPSAGENIVYQGSQLTITYMITLLGTQALTVRVITFNIMWLIMMTSMSLAQGTQIIVGHRVGAHRFEDAYKTCFYSLRIAVFFSFSLAVFFYLLSPYIVGFFTQDPTIIKMSSLLLALAIVIEPGRAFNMVIINALKAAGDAKFPAIVGIISMCGVAVGLSYVLGIHFGFGLIGIWIAYAADEWLRGITMFFRWRSGIWKSKVLTSR